MKVLIVNSVCGKGSTGKIVVDIANAVADNGGEALICYGRGETSFKNSLKIASKLGVYTHIALTRLTDRHGLYSKSATRALIKKIEEYSPDIINLHNIHGYYLNYKLLFAFLAKYNKPVVWTLHDAWSFTGHCAHFDEEICSKWQVNCEKCMSKKEYPASILIDNSKLNFKQKKLWFNSVKNMVLVTPSQWLADQAKKSFLSQNKILTINNGIDLNIFNLDKEEKSVENEKKVIKILACANIWTEEKGYPDLVKLKNILGKNYALTVVGVNQAQKAELEKQDITAICRTEGQKELAELYKNADIFVNPTYKDNYPTVNLEAIACGTPVVTYATAGCGESVNNDVGAVVEKGNILKLAKAVEDTANRSISKISIAQYGKKFDKVIAFKKYVDLFTELVTAEK